MADIPIELANLLDEGHPDVKTAFYQLLHTVKQLQSQLEDRDKKVAYLTTQLQKPDLPPKTENLDVEFPHP